MPSNWWPDCEVITHGPTREDWLKARSVGLGGSDLVILLGHGYKSGRTERQLWLEKTGQVASEESGGNLRMRRGNALEAFIGEELLNHIQKEVDPHAGMDRVGLVQSIAHPCMVGSADFRIRLAGMVVAGGEGKEIAHYQTAQAVRAAEHISQYPRFYWQGVHYLAVTGAPTWWWGIDSPYYDKLVTFRLDREECLEDIERAIELCEMWWERHVVLGFEVDPAAGMDAEVVPLLDDTVEARLPWQVAEDLERLRELNYPGTNEGKAEKAAIQARLAEEIGGHKVLTLMGEPVIRWHTSTGRGTFDTKGLKEAAPELYEKFWTPGGGRTRSIRLVR